MTAASESAQRLLRVNEDLAVQLHHNDLLAVMGSAEGRRFVWELIGTAGVFRQSFGPDALATAFSEGRRSIGLELLARLQDEAPDAYLKAQGEFIESQRKFQAIRDAAQAEAEHNQEENPLV